jgi:hypothetical protein
MLHTGAEGFVGNVEKCQPAVCARTSVDAFGRQETLPGIFDRVRSGAYEMGDAASY